MQKNNFFIIEKFENTESAQLSTIALSLHDCVYSVPAVRSIHNRGHVRTCSRKTVSGNGFRVARCL